MTNFDTIVIASGVIGSAVAYRLTRCKLKVLELGHCALRALRANFDFFWAQGKGLGRPEYAEWCSRASEIRPDFTAELGEATGIDFRHSRPGGVDLALSDDALQQAADALAEIQRDAGTNAFTYGSAGTA